MTEAELKDTFAPFGEVKRAKIVKDRDTNRSKGFGFVEIENDADALKAIEALNNKEVGGRALRVNESKPKEYSTFRDSLSCNSSLLYPSRFLTKILLLLIITS